jgi:anti-sigma B factor antagonist
MRFKETQRGDVEVFSLSGKVMGGEDLDELRRHLVEQLDQGRRFFIIHMAGVEWMNSLGLGLLIGFHVSVSKRAGRFALANVESVRRVLTHTRLIEVLDTYESCEQALQSFHAMAYDEGM